MTAYVLERAWVKGAVHDEVRVEIQGGRFTEVELLGQSHHFQGNISAEKRSDPRLTGDRSQRLPGLTIPGLANCHSHAFHRALRGRTQRERGTFWTWREQMYAVAERLEPDSYLALARATYREMVASGVTAVGEFHYLHHQADGTPYDDPNAMGRALQQAARDAGLRIRLLDTAYLSSGFGEPPVGVQERFSDGTADAWAERVQDLDSAGAAIHSVRAVPDDQLRTIVDASKGLPLHVHLSEQTAENDACVAAYGATPTQLLADHGVLGPMTSAVHATHLTDDDIGHLGTTRTLRLFLPHHRARPRRRHRPEPAPARRGQPADPRLRQPRRHRPVRGDARRRARRAARHPRARALVGGRALPAATTDGHASLGYDDAGAIAVGNRADLVTLDTTTPRTAGTGRDEHTAVFTAAAADVVQVVADGRVVFARGDEHEIGRELDATIGRLWT